MPRTPLFAVLLAVALAEGGASAAPKDSLDGRVEALLSRMSLEEKVGQRVQWNHWGPLSGERLEAVRKGAVGSFLNVHGAEATNAVQKEAVEGSRLGIPLIFGIDVIHGYRTIFPVPLALSCSFDPGLAERCERVAAREARAAGIHWTFAPMVDLARDPRWGRILEGAGEDAYLAERFAEARVRGFQGESLASPDSIAACAKHFAAYGAAEGGRDYNTTDVSEPTLREYYLRPFRAAVRAGVRTLMSGFNDLNGIPATGNRWLLRDILKGEWGFPGFVVSDWASVKELVDHGYAEDLRDAALKGARAGVDMEMEGGAYAGHLAYLVKAGKVSRRDLDDSVRRILRLKFELGLFDAPYADPAREKETLLAPAHVALAREAARESIVLLKNDGGLLPLPPDVQRLAVIGSLAKSQEDPLGEWHCRGEAKDVVSLWEGIRERVSSKTELLYAEGAAPDAPADPSKIREAVRAAKKAGLALLVVGEKRNMSGEAASRTDLGLPGGQRELVQAVAKAGVPFVLVLMNGRPLVIPEEAAAAGAVLETWFLGVQHGPAAADVLFGDHNPSGRLTASFPRSVGQVPVHYDARRTGRPAADSKWTSKYLDSPNEPLYPFGYGLSYTEFRYSDLEVLPERAPFRGKVTVRARVANVGKREGVETVQLYVRDVAASRTRPLRELKGFHKVRLAPGASKTVEFTLRAEDLSFWGPEGGWITEPGEFRVFVGPNAAEGLEGSFRLLPES